MQQNEYIDKDTLLFWLKFYFNKRISECISIDVSDNYSVEDSIKEGNKKFIDFCHKITDIMNGRLYDYYEPFIIIEDDNEIEIDNYEDDDFDEYISDDPYDYLSNNATAIDKLQIYLSIPVKYDCFSWDVYKIFDEYNTDFMGLNNNDNTLKIYTPIFYFQIYKFPDAIDVFIIPTDIDITKKAITTYFNLYKNNCLFSTQENIRDYASSIKRFYNYLKESGCVLSNFYYEGEEHLHALFSLAVDDKIKINSIKGNKICLNAEDFVNNYGSNSLSSTDSRLKLPEVDIHIISLKYYIEQVTGEKATYRKIAEYMSNNGIYRITENNIKQRVNMHIYTRLGVKDLTQAVYILKEHNMLKSY